MCDKGRECKSSKQKIGRERERVCAKKRQHACVSVCLRLIRSKIHANEPCGCVCFAFFAFSLLFAVVVVGQEGRATERGWVRKRGGEVESQSRRRRAQKNVSRA